MPRRPLAVRWGALLAALALVALPCCGDRAERAVEPPDVVEGIIEAQGASLRELLGRVRRLRDSVVAAASARGDLDAALRAEIDASVAHLELLEPRVEAYPEGQDGEALTEAETLRRELGALDAAFAGLRRRLID